MGIGLTHFKKLGSLKPVVILLLITLVSETASRPLAHYIKNSNLVYHFLDPLQTILWGCFFYCTIKVSKKKTTVICLTASLTIYSILDSIFVQGFSNFPDTFLSIQSIILICFGSFLFFEKLDTSTNNNIFIDSEFLIALAVIWFYLISFLFFYFHRFSLSKTLSKTTLRTVNYTSNYVYYLLILFAVILKSFAKGKNIKNEFRH